MKVVVRFEGTREVDIPDNWLEYDEAGEKNPYYSAYDLREDAPEVMGPHSILLPAEDGDLEVCAIEDSSGKTIAEW